MTQLQAMLLSMASEAVVAGAAAWGWRLPAWRAGVAAVAATAVTHWPLWQVFAQAAGAIGYWPALFGLEAAVVLVETLVYRALLRCRWRAAALLSLAANAASTMLGLAIYWLW
jgi:hypothetical protein